jgi:hypothetical protein
MSFDQNGLHAVAADPVGSSSKACSPASERHPEAVSPHLARSCGLPLGLSLARKRPAQRIRPLPATAQVASKGPVTQTSITPEVINARLEDSAERTRAISAKGAARIAIIDFDWPQDKDEYLALGKYIPVLVSAVSQQADELPLKRVYIESNGREDHAGKDRQHPP